MWNLLSEWLTRLNIPSWYLPSLGFTDFLDIAIVASLLYLILQWIRRTQAWSLLKGIIIVLFVSSAAFLFNLVTVQWIVQNAFAMGIMVIVILFQPELRKALERIGKGLDFPSIRGDSEKDARISGRTVNETVKAVKAMSQNVTGALICFERNVTLTDHEQLGIQIDALVSSQMLINIFTHNTPLHDGAVMIRHNRIASAGCVLPLTAEALDEDLGTRHRAALGLSEASDALVVVVSEETGTVSTAHSGKLTRGLNEYQLRDWLIRASYGGDPNTGPRRRGRRVALRKSGATDRRDSRHDHEDPKATD